MMKKLKLCSEDNTNMKKFLTNFLSVLMALAVLMTTTVVAFAADPVAMSNGTCMVQLSKTRYV